MIARLLTFLSVVFELPSIPARESRNGAEIKTKKKAQAIGAETKQRRQATTFTAIT